MRRTRDVARKGGSMLFDFTKGEQTDKATRALHRMALSETVP